MMPVPKYLSTGHWPQSQTVHRDDTYLKDPSEFVNAPVVITEKLDGGNTCLARGEAYARATGRPSHDGWFAMVRKHHAWKTMNDPADLYTYGEDLYGIHSIEYEPLREEETYRVFAVRSGDMFLSWPEVEARAAELNCLTVPLLYRGKFSSLKEITEFFNDVVASPSRLGGPCEGAVMRVERGFHADEFSRCVTKFVRPHHVQTDEHWTKNWQPARIRRDG